MKHLLKSLMLLIFFFLINAGYGEESASTLSELERGTAFYQTSFIKTAATFIAFLGLIILTIWMFKKLSYGRMRTFNSLKAIKILERRPLSPKSILYLIEVRGKQILIAESQVQVHALTTLEWQAPDKEL